MVSRTYAQIVSGVTTKMEYDPKTKEFMLQYFTSYAVKDDTTQVTMNMLTDSSGAFVDEIFCSVVGCRSI